MTSQATQDPAVTRGTWFRMAWLLLPVLSVVYQIFAKETSGALTGLTMDAQWVDSLLHIRTFWLMVGCEILSFGAWMIVLNAMPLSEAFPASAISYVFILVVSWTMFSEAASWLQAIGSLFILTGVWLVARAQTDTHA